MSLKIRLSRGGAKKRPFYRVVVADSRFPRDGRFIEKLGTFDPLKAKDAADRLVLDAEKAKAWIAKGAQPTDRVARLLESVGVGEARGAQQSAKGAAEEEGAGTRRRGRERCGSSRRVTRMDARLGPHAEESLEGASRSARAKASTGSLVLRDAHFVGSSG